MTLNLAKPFQAIDMMLADRICRWFNASDDTLLWQTVAATSLALQQGHSCLSLELCLQELPYSQMELYGGRSFPDVKTWVSELEKYELTIAANSPIVLDKNRMYLRRYWQFETEVGEFFALRRTRQTDLSRDRLKHAKRLLAEHFPATNPQPDQQKLAAMNCLFGNTNIIIGGPGTGKTYTVTRILALLAALSDHPPLIKLAAPTGKAAQRLGEAIREAKRFMNLDMLINEAIPDNAQTLHRLLGVIPNHLQFHHDASNPIEADILLIDEVSMVDLPLMTRLCRAIKPTTHLILLGDADQLPSVAAGSVLADLVEKPHVGYSEHRVKRIKQLDNSISLTTSKRPADYVTELRYSRRFAEGSGIGVLAKQISDGAAAESLLTFTQFEDLNRQSPDNVEQALVSWAHHYYASIAQQPTLSEGFEQLKSFRILCAVKEGERGVEFVNETIRKRLNYNREPFYKGQPIMVTQNHYGLKLFNGDIGLVWPDASGQLMAWFENIDQPRAVALGRLPATETVYAMTIHKTQGSEFDHVVMILPDTSTAMVTRELLYTGLTRAKKQFTYVGEDQSWREGVKNKVKRWAGLADRIQ